jgi:hypothetical protein
MKKTNKILLLFWVILAFGCEDVLEKDISSKSIDFTFPLTNAVVVSNTVNFQWNKLEGVKTYRLQIFDKNQFLILEKVTEDLNHSYTFQNADEYQWRIRGENFAYNSNYTSFIKFTVVSPIDLSTQNIILTNPTNNLNTNNKNLYLNWQSLPNVTGYKLDVINTTSGQNVYSIANLSTNNSTLSAANLAQDGIYQWKVQGFNLTSITPVALATFSLDTTLPNQPTLIAPSNNSVKTINQAVVFSWSIAQDAGVVQSPINYTIEFSVDNNFSTILQSSTATTSSFSQTFLTANTIYWRVKAQDSAGNVGITSAPFKLTIN